MDLKLGILLNKEINNLIELLAKRMGTSKRNVISLALTRILDNNISKEKIDILKNTIHGLDHATNITVNEEFKKKLEGINRYGLSIRVFFGYVICDYFYKNYHSFLGNDVLHEDSSIYEVKKENIQAKLDKTMKAKITTYCNEHSIAVSSLFSHYVMNKEITINNFSSTEKESITLTFSKGVKSRFQTDAKAMNVDYFYYINLIAAQICKDLDL